MKNIKLSGYQKYTINIEVSGTIIGKIWMPATYAYTPFTINVNNMREQMSDSSLTILEAIERYLAYNTGDFQSVSLIDCEVTLWYYKEVKRSSTNTYYERNVRTFNLMKYKPLKEYKASKKEKYHYNKIINSIYA